MNRLKAKGLYVAEDRIITKAQHNRFLRLLGKIDSEETVMTNHEHITLLLIEDLKKNKTFRTGLKRTSPPNYLLTTFDWNDPLNNPLRASEYAPSEPGRITFADYRNSDQLLNKMGVACNSAWEIHTAEGCMHSCNYCHVGDTFTIMLDVEEFIEKLDKMMDNNPKQRLYKYDNRSDINTLEPEYGATKLLIEHFAKKPDKSLMLYSKSDNIDHILDVEHNSRTIACWTLSCEEVAEKYEPGTPTTKKRIEAARKAQEAGYRIRFRFSPIIPIKDWKEKNAKMIAETFKHTHPEIISIETLCHMSKEQCLKLYGDNLDIQPQNNPTEYELFSHEERKEIYRFFIDEIRKHDKKATMALCLETPKMWNDLSDILPGTYKNFACCCGERCG